MTNTLTTATAPGPIDGERRRGVRSTDVPLPAATTVYPTDNYLSLGINCRHSGNADGLPAEKCRVGGEPPDWGRRARWLHACVCSAGKWRPREQVQ